MSATSRALGRPWAVAHRTVLFLAVAIVVIAAAITVPLVLLRGGTSSPAQEPATVVQHDSATVPAPCAVQQIGKPRPC
jgi:hypothetical protein